MAEDEENDEETEKKDRPPEAKPISAPPSKEADRQQEYPPPPGYAQQGYGPPQPFFRADNLQRILAMFLLLGVIVLLVGAILVSASDFVKIDDKDPEDDYDLQRNLDAAGHLVGAIGLFLIALLAVFLPMLLIPDLSDRQKTLLMYIMVAVIIGFAFMATV